MPDMKVISFLSTVYAVGKQQQNKRVIIMRHLSLVTPSMGSEWGEKGGINDRIKLNYAAALKTSEHLSQRVAKYLLQLQVSCLCNQGL